MDEQAVRTLESLAEQMRREFRGLRARVDLDPVNDFEDAYLWLEFEGDDEAEFRDAFNFARAQVEKLWQEQDLHVTIKHVRRRPAAEETESEPGKHWD